jgi:CRP-like cAMP-binding protein
MINLIDHLADHTALSNKLIAALEQNLCEERYQPHQILFAAGSQESRLFFMQSGLARIYYYDRDGEEHTIRFIEANEILFSINGYYNVANWIYTEFLEESLAFTLLYDDLHEMEADFPELRSIVKKEMLNVSQMEFEQQCLIRRPSEDRYLRFRQQKNHLFQKVPINIIASYLNISRTTLTRLMARF